MPDQSITLTEGQVAYLLKIVRNDMVRAGEWGDQDAYLTCHRLMWSAHMRNQEVARAAAPRPAEGDG